MSTSARPKSHLWNSGQALPPAPVQPRWKQLRHQRSIRRQRAIWIQGLLLLIPLGSIAAFHWWRSMESNTVATDLPLNVVSKVVVAQGLNATPKINSRPSSPPIKSKSLAIVSSEDATAKQKPGFALSQGAAPGGDDPRNLSRHHPIFESSEPLTETDKIDQIAVATLRQHNLTLARRCSDAVFLRRAYVDVTGTLPTNEQAAAFLQDLNPDKRSALVDQLLDSPLYADYWAMKWSDILRVKAEFPINLWPAAAHAYYRWIHAAVTMDMPYDRFATELLTSSGSNFRDPQVNFYRAMQNRDADQIAKTVALTFMGSRAEKWPAKRLADMSKFFFRVGYKTTGEWKEEIIFFDRYARQANDDVTEPSAIDSPTAISTRYPSGAAVELVPHQDPRVVFAQWLVDAQNPWFSRAVANRVWSWLMGRGIVEPVDDICPDNLPSNRELLDYLASQLKVKDFRVKELIREIMKSSVYQQSSLSSSPHERAGELFANYHVRRHDAEVLIDAINAITGTGETYMSIVPEPFTWLPEGQRAVTIPDGSITSAFLELFGRPARDTGMADERDNRFTAQQALHLLNSNHLRSKLSGDGLKRLSKTTLNSSRLAEQLYLTILSRFPSEQELIQADALCRQPPGMKELAWALINSDEFLYQH